jgi:hypothetical protein
MKSKEVEGAWPDFQKNIEYFLHTSNCQGRNVARMPLSFVAAQTLTQTLMQKGKTLT